MMPKKVPTSIPDDVKQGSNITTIHINDNHNFTILVSDLIIKLKLFIVFYMMYGHVEGLARRIKRGISDVDGVKRVLCRVLETLSIEDLDHMKAILRTLRYQR